MKKTQKWTKKAELTYTDYVNLYYDIDAFREDIFNITWKTARTTEIISNKKPYDDVQIERRIKFKYKGNSIVVNNKGFSFNGVQYYIDKSLPSSIALEESMIKMAIDNKIKFFDLPAGCSVRDHYHEYVKDESYSKIFNSFWTVIVGNKINEIEKFNQKLVGGQKKFSKRRHLADPKMITEFNRMLYLERGEILNITKIRMLAIEYEKNGTYELCQRCVSQFGSLSSVLNSISNLPSVQPQILPIPLY